MNTCGFKQYGALNHIKFLKHKETKYESVDTRDKKDDILDIIFAIDPVTNLPAGSIEQYLSDKTRDEVRLFIEQNLLYDLPDTSMCVPDTLREDLLNLDSEFIAKVSRNRYEDKESYESRVQSYFQELEHSKEKQKIMRELNSRYKKDKKDE